MTPAELRKRLGRLDLTDRRLLPASGLASPRSITISTAGGQSAA